MFHTIDFRRRKVFNVARNEFDWFLFARVLCSQFLCSFKIFFDLFKKGKISFANPALAMAWWLLHDIKNGLSRSVSQLVPRPKNFWQFGGEEKEKKDFFFALCWYAHTD